MAITIDDDFTLEVIEEDEDSAITPKTPPEIPNLEIDETCDSYPVEEKPKKNNKNGCSLCHYNSSDNKYENLKKNLLKVKIAVCVCGFIALTLASLDRHMTVCKGNLQKKYTCTLCNFTSARNSTLSKHNFKIHNRNNEFKKCTICQYKTGQGQHKMDSHLLTKHGVFRCRKCEFTTAIKKRLKEHRKSHA